MLTLSSCEFPRRRRCNRAAWLICLAIFNEFNAAAVHLLISTATIALTWQIFLGKATYICARRGRSRVTQDDDSYSIYHWEGDDKSKFERILSQDDERELW